MRKIISLLACLLSTNVSAFSEMSTLTQTKTFSLNSKSLTNDSPIPKRYTCDGEDVSPDLTWNNPPAKTKSFALILSDPDAPGGRFYHWVLYNLPPTLTNLSEGLTQLPEGAMHGKNSWGRARYNGPCPPKGSTHRYIFTLYALDTVLPLSADSDVATVLESLENNILAKTSFTAKFGH